MRKMLFLILLVSCAGFAQTDSGFLQYSEGDYAELPFRYTTVLSLEQVRELVRHIAGVTDGEIEGIYYRSPKLRVAGDEIYVHVCAKGIRAARRCDQGTLYMFVRDNDQWRRKNNNVAGWAY